MLAASRGRGPAAAGGAFGFGEYSEVSRGEGRGRFSLSVRHAGFANGSMGAGDARPGCLALGQSRNYTLQTDGLRCAAACGASMYGIRGGWVEVRDGGLRFHGVAMISRRCDDFTALR